MVKRAPNLFESLLPIVFLIILLTYNVFVFGDSAVGGPNQISLLITAAFVGILALRIGVKWEELSSKMVDSIHAALPSILILLLIGSLSGTWLLSGVVPTMVYYGLQVLQPEIFLFATVIVCAITSLVTGSSWTTIATVGIALMGIGKALGFSDGLIAGAIISGAYFGDKMSPLSDTTNLAPAMAGTDLFTHIRYMLYTTIPSIVITLIAFLVIGFMSDHQDVDTSVELMLQTIESSFNITPVLFLVPIILFVLILKKMPPLPALMAGTLLGGLFAVVFQPDLVQEIGGEGSIFKTSYIAFMKAMFGEISFTTNNEIVNKLFQSSGMSGMLNTIWLILSAMVFGGVMGAAGFLQRITKAIIYFVTGTGSLVGATVTSCVFFNITASDQYLAIVVPGRMFESAYKDRGLSPELLSRSLEDGATVTSVLVPWNTCGAAQTAVLHVATLTYLPFAFFNLLSPFMSILFAYLRIKISFLNKTNPTS